MARRPLKLAPHLQSLKGLLRRAWQLPLKDSESLLHRVSTPGELKQELERAPRLVYVYAHVRGDGEALELLLEDEAGKPVALPFAELLAMLPRERPKVLVIHTVGGGSLAPAVPGISALLHLRQDTPGPAGARPPWIG